MNCTPKVEHKTFGVQFTIDSLFGAGRSISVQIDTGDVFATVGEFEKHL